MLLASALILPFAVVLTVIPGIKTICKAQGPPAAFPLSLPNCADSALQSALKASNCEQNDEKCICGHPRLLPGVYEAIRKSCSPASQDDVRAFGDVYCGIDPHSSSIAGTSPISMTRTQHHLPTGHLPEIFSVHSVHVTAPFASLVTDTSLAPTSNATRFYAGTGTRTRARPNTATALPTYMTTARTGDAAELGFDVMTMAVAVGMLGWAFTRM